MLSNCTARIIRGSHKEVGHLLPCCLYNYGNENVHALSVGATPPSGAPALRDAE